MKVKNYFTKEDLLEAFDLYYESLRNFIYYKTGDICLADDLVQEIFMKVWEKKAEVRKESVKSLLFTIGRNLIIDHIRHKKIINGHQDNTLDKFKQEYKSPQFILEEKEFENQLNVVLELMPVECREVFLMGKLDQLKYQEIAGRLQLSVKAIEKRMSKAIGIVRKHLGVEI